MSLNDTIHLLSQLPILEDFSKEQLRLIAFSSQNRNYRAGDEIFHNGQAADGGYLVLNGQIEWVTTSERGYSQSEILGRGALLGEMALISAVKRYGDAHAITDCEIHRITRPTVHRVLDEYPELAASLHQRIASRIINFSRDLDPVLQKLQSLDQPG